MRPEILTVGHMDYRQAITQPEQPTPKVCDCKDVLCPEWHSSPGMPAYKVTANR